MPTPKRITITAVRKARKVTQIPVVRGAFVATDRGSGLMNEGCIIGYCPRAQIAVAHHILTTGEAPPTYDAAHDALMDYEAFVYLARNPEERAAGQRYLTSFMTWFDQFTALYGLVVNTENKDRIDRMAIEDAEKVGRAYREGRL